jgi:uncharacterized membrane protein
MDLPLHPRIVHLPIALSVLMPLISLGVGLCWWKGALPRRSWGVVVALQSTLALSGFIALSSGQIDAEVVGQVIAKSAIEAHEAAATLFVFAALAVLPLTVSALVAKRERAARIAALISIAGTLLVFALAYRTADAGGRLVYELGAARAFTTLPSPAGSAAPTTTKRP